MGRGSPPPNGIGLGAYILVHFYAFCDFSIVNGDKSAKLEVGERYIQVWAPDNGRVPFSSIITI